MTNENCQNPCVTCNSAISGAAGLGLSPLDPNYPYVNLSAEAPDRDLFAGVAGQNLGYPPLGSTWYAVGCLGFCFSSSSQVEADLCAANQAALCVSGQWPLLVPNPNVGPDEPPFIQQNRPMFGNFPQSCNFTCPDGSIYTHTVRAGAFLALNQASADAWASSYACQSANFNYICVSAISPARGCYRGVYSGVVTVMSPNKPVSVQVSAGALPPGLVIQQGINPNLPTFFFSGSPTSAGSYSFTLLVTDSNGNTATKGLTIEIFGIVDGSQLPDPTINIPYSHSLTIGGTVDGSLVFSIASGSLPPGLSLDSSTGEISGTPTQEGAFQAQITVADNSISCTRSFDIFVDAAVGACGIFTGLTWPAPTIELEGDGVGSGSGTGNTFSMGGSVGPSGPDNNSSNVFLNGSLFYTGPEMTCCVNYFADIVNGASHLVVYQDGVPIAEAFPGGGAGSLSFTIAESLVPSEIIIAPSTTAGSSAGEGQPAASASLSGTIGGCP